MSSQDRRKSINQQRILKQSFEIISVKFILNLPKQQKIDKTRLAYHYQKAYYYYIDELSKQLFIKNNGKIVQSKWFFDRLNQVIGRYIKKIQSDQIIKIMSKNKPTCGAIIMNKKQNKVLVIEFCGKYGFPKGGKNQNETAEDCAAREVKEEVGLFIHNLINRRGNVPITYFIIRKFDENQELKIDHNEIHNAFWMGIDVVCKNICKFTEKSRIAWRQFESKINMQSKLSIQQFLNIYRDKQQQDNINQITTNNNNPLTNFSLNKQRLFAVFRDIDD